MDDINIEVQYSKRKSFKMSVNEEGKLIINAPLGTTQEIIEEVLEKKKEWIKKTVELVNSRFKLKDTEVLYLGKIYRKNVIVKPSLRKDFIDINDDEININVALRRNSPKLLETWFKERALESILEYIKLYEERFPCKVNGVKIRAQKTRWGSCSYDNRMSFNWRLIMAKDICLEYVVVHEMCHMVHKNHSKDYWALVESIMPKFKEAENWLKKNAYLLGI